MAADRVKVIIRADGEPSGFIDAVRKLEGTSGVSVVRLTKRDIVRHPLVQRVVEAYGRSEPAV